MKKNTIKTLALATVILLGLTQVNADIEADPADKLTMNIWSNEQTVELSKQDAITNLAWSKEDNTLVAQCEYKINAYAADIEEKSVESTDKADTVTKNIWSNEQAVELSKQDAITNLAWSKEDNTLVAQGEYKINAYAADIEEKSVESTDKADTVTKNVWCDVTNKNSETKEDAISRKAWL